MKAIVPARINPEDEELARKRLELAQLESELADRELFVATLRAELLAFESLYLRTVGARYAELDEIQAQVAERLAQEHEGDQQAQESAQTARAQANESHSTVNAQAAQPLKVSPSQELKALFREVAKRVHPDLASDPDDRERRHQLMAEANRAYEMGDFERLKQILEQYQSSPEAVRGDGTGAELVRAIRKISQIKKRLAEIEREIEQLNGADVATLKAKADEYQKQGRDLLAEMAQQVDERIAILRQQGR